MIFLMLPLPSEVFENFDSIKEWAIFLGLLIAVAIGVLTLLGMGWKSYKRRKEEDNG
jgi:hypothetical protein